MGSFCHYAVRQTQKYTRKQTYSCTHKHRVDENENSVGKFARIHYYFIGTCDRVIMLLIIEEYFKSSFRLILFLFFRHFPHRIEKLLTKT